MQQELLTVQGLVPLSVTLRYDSKRLKTGPFGRGWEDPSFGASLQELDNGDIKVYWSVNRYNRFLKQALRARERRVVPGSWGLFAAGKKICLCKSHGGSDF